MLKKTWKTILIVGLYSILILIIIVLLFFDWNNMDRIKKIDSSKIISITLVNNHSGQAKKITGHKYIALICRTLNETEMHHIKNWNGNFKRMGGASFSFIFTFLTQRTIEVIYYDGSYLVNNGEGYSIKSTEFENYWNLNYKEQKYTYAGIR